MTVSASEASDGSDIKISCETSADRTEWDYYVRAHAQGTFFNLSGWLEAISSAYQYNPVYIIARRQGAVAGVLPLVDVRSPLLGRSLISTAFTIGGGPLADDAPAMKALLDAAETLGADRRVRYIECRSDFSDNDDWHAKPTTAAVFRLALPENEDAALKAIPKRRRADIRKAIAAAKDGSITVRYDGDPDIFYRLYAQSLRKLGTPVFPKRFLNALLNSFEAETEISVIERQGEPVAALLTFHYDGAALPYYVGASDAARSVHAFDYLYWNVMRHAVENGYSVFDFGRSQMGSGAYHYKKLWGITPEPLTYRVKLITAASPPNVSAKNPKFSAFSKLWPRLPAFAANRIGPLLAPNFP